MWSIYTTIYLINKNNCYFYKNLVNYSNFVGEDGEVVIGTNKEGIQDGTKDILDKFIEDNNLKNVKLLISDISFSDNTFDGALKNFALQNTKYSIKIQMDIDETFVLSQKERWKQATTYLSRQNGIKALFIPSIDLYGSEKYIRKNYNVSQKWRIHKEGLFRGVFNGGKMANNRISTISSDTCELVDALGNLVPTGHIIPDDTFLKPINVGLLKDYIYTLHWGYVDLQYRRDINKNWWKEKWEDRSGKPENVVTELDKLIREEVIEHHLLLE